MQFGLTQNIVEEINKIFEQNSKVDEVILFGSRAKGNYRDDSDIDLAVKGRSVSSKDILSLGVKLESLNLAYKIDLINYATINDKDVVEHIDRIGIVFYSRWRKMKFSDFVDINPSISLKSGEQYSFVEMKDLKDGNKFCFPNEERKLSGGARFKESDTLFARITPCLENGKICNVKGLRNGIGFGSTEFLVFRGRENVSDNDFVFYLSRWNDVRDFAEGNFEGTSGRQRVSKDCFANLILTLPPYYEQISIAETLRSLDDKIDLLHRQNKTLEQLAETLFRQWFVEEAEESWEVDVLENVFDIGIGRTPPRKEQRWFSINPNDVKWISIKDMGTNGVYVDAVSEYLTEEALKQFNVPIIPANAVLLSFKMTIGRLAISTERMLSNEAIAHFKQKENSVLFPEFLYLFLKAFRFENLGSTSSIVESINSEMIKKMEIIIPDIEKLDEFKNLIKPHFEKIKTNQKQIRSLTQLRDTILPKLMSGEIRIADET